MRKEEINGHGPESRRARRRFDELSPSLPFTPVLLANSRPVRGIRRILFLAALGFLSLPLLNESAFGKNLSAKIKGIFPAPTQSNGVDRRSLTPSLLSSEESRGFFLAAHTNVGHSNTAGVNRSGTNVHTNNPSKHVNVSSEVGHFNSTRPHSNSHFNNPHVNTPHSNTPHSNVNVPDKTGRESG